MLDFFKKHLLFEINDLEQIDNLSEFELIEKNINFKFQYDVHKFNAIKCYHSLDFLNNCLLILNNCGDLKLKWAIDKDKECIEIFYVFYNYKISKVDFIKFIKSDTKYNYNNKNNLLSEALLFIVSEIKNKDIETIDEIELFYSYFVKAKENEKIK